MHTKDKYIQPIAEVIEMEVQSSIMSGSDVGIGGDIDEGDGPLRSRRNFWRNNE